MAEEKIYELYNGSYKVTPVISTEQVLKTEEKLLTDDITVYKIPLTASSTPNGGKIVRIGTDWIPSDPPVSPDDGSSSETPLIRRQITSEFGNIKDYPEVYFDYIGYGETGVKFVLKFTGAVTKIRLNNVTTEQHMILDTNKIKTITGDFGDPIKNFDVITISTYKGSKFITLDREFNTYNIMHALTEDSEWLYIDRGINHFTCTADSGFDHMKVYFEYPVRTLGV